MRRDLNPLWMNRLHLPLLKRILAALRRTIKCARQKTGFQNVRQGNFSLCKKDFENKKFFPLQTKRPLNYEAAHRIGCAAVEHFFGRLLDQSFSVEKMMHLFRGRRHALRSSLPSLFSLPQGRRCNHVQSGKANELSTGVDIIVN